jgi:hypothetical protein
MFPCPITSFGLQSSDPTVTSSSKPSSFSFPLFFFSSLLFSSFPLLFASSSFNAVLPFPLQVEMICAGLQTLVFVGARKLTEIVCNSARDMLKAKVPFPSFASFVLAYPPPPYPLGSPFTRLPSRLPALAGGYPPPSFLPLRLSIEPVQEPRFFDT